MKPNSEPSSALRELRSVVVGSLMIGWFYGFNPLKRNIYWSLHHGLTPLSILFFIYLYGGGRGVVFALAGGLVMITVSTSISLETDAAFNRLVLRLHDMYVSSPISPAAHVIGLALASQLAAIPGLLIFLSLITYFVQITPISVLIILASLAFTWGIFSVVGFIISTTAKDLKDLWTWSPIISMLISLLPPVFYPLKFFPNRSDGRSF